MAINYQAEYNAIYAMQPLCSKTTDFTLLSNALEPLIVEAQTRAIATDADAIAFLIANRQFLLNNGGTDLVFVYNGFPFTFLAGKSYSMQSDEQSFFYNAALEAGIGALRNDPSGSGYFGGNGEVQFYFF